MPDSTSPRAYILSEVTFPERFRVIDGQDMPETLSQPTVCLKHLRIEPLPEARAGHIRNVVVVTIADHHETQATAENELDISVVEILTALDGHRRISWTDAEKVLVGGRYLGWDITLSVITSRKETA